MNRQQPFQCSSSLIISYFSADERLHERRDSLCIVGHDGSVSWIPQAIFKSSCDIDVKAFPFDKQKCHLKFGSWTYDGLQLDLFFKDNKEEMDTSEFQFSNVWHVISAVGKKNKVTYTCCPEPFIDLTFSITIRRKATFYAYTLILPCVLLTSLTLILFWIPAESPAKLTLGKVMNLTIADDIFPLLKNMLSFYVF